MKKITHIRHSQRNRKQGGWTAVEMNMSNLVYSVLVIAAVSLGVNMLSNANSNALTTGHRIIVDNLRDNYKNTNVTTGLNNTVAVSLEVAPPAWMSGTASIVNNLNGAVTIATSTISATGDAFTVAQAGLDADECRDFVNDVFPEAYTITVGSTTVKAAGATVSNPATIGTACNNATNTVTPRYTRQ